MELDPTSKFNKNLKQFSKTIRNKFYKQANFLLRDIRHSSLCAKKYDETSGAWQARVDKNVRFYFLIEKNKYTLIDIRYHD